MPVICVDVMGSDQSPEVVLEGVRMALEKDKELEVLLAGADEFVTPFANKHNRAKALV
ncbi:MAG: phosphate--acyl-ACP acyltransferase, partial [Atopobium sp.]|nr:phosphate--acyl-ACP acyltransferase [Atopobium sp.]